MGCPPLYRGGSNGGLPCEVVKRGLPSSVREKSVLLILGIDKGPAPVQHLTLPSSDAAGEKRVGGSVWLSWCSLVICISVGLPRSVLNREVDI